MRESKRKGSLGTFGSYDGAIQGRVAAHTPADSPGTRLASDGSFVSGVALALDFGDLGGCSGSALLRVSGCDGQVADDE